MSKFAKKWWYRSEQHGGIIPVKGIYLTANSKGKLVRCGISDDIIQTLADFVPWTATSSTTNNLQANNSHLVDDSSATDKEEVYYDVHVADLYTTISAMREYKQQLKRLKYVCLFT